MSLRVSPVRTRFGIASLLDGGTRIAQPRTLLKGNGVNPIHPLLPSFPASLCYRTPASAQFPPSSCLFLSSGGSHDEASPPPPAATTPAPPEETSCRISWPFRRTPANGHNPARSSKAHAERAALRGATVHKKSIRSFHPR